MLRRGDRSCYDNVSTDEVPAFTYRDRKGQQHTTTLRAGRGSIERAIWAIIVNSGTEWRKDSSLEVAYRYYSHQPHPARHRAVASADPAPGRLLARHLLWHPDTRRTMIYTKPRPPRLALADLITPLVVFVIFTNIAVLAVHFHGLPTIAAILPVALLLIPLAYHVLIRRQPIVMPPATLWLVLFMLVLMVSTLFARDVPAAFSELVTYLTEGLLLYMLLVNVIRTSTVLRLVLWALLAATIVLGGVPLYQQLTGTFGNNYGGLAQTTEASFPHRRSQPAGRCAPGAAGGCDW
jgi:hypothetical protein